MKLPRLHVVTDDEVVARPKWLAAATAVLEGGGPDVALHVRAPRTDGGRVFEYCRALAPVAEAAGSRLVVNDRVDVALTLGLDVHLGRRSLAVPAARGVLGPKRRIGVSCRDEGEVHSAAEAGADYVFFGNVFDTPSHPGRAGSGVGRVRLAATASAGLPVLAIGGIDVRNALEVIRAGAWGVAVLRGIWDAGDSRAAAVEYISALGNVEEER